MTGAVALYMRLSSEDGQAGESCSIGNQRDLLYGFVREHREFDGCGIMEFCDDGYSGMSFARPGIKKLLALAGGTVGCIIVKDFSRFGRNLVEVGDYLDRVFPFLGVRFIAVNEGYDSKAEFGRTVGLDVSLKAMVHEMYCRDISEKIRSVKLAKTRRGEYLGGIAFYGYKKSEAVKNRLEVDGPAAEVVRRIFRMAAEGAGMSEIAKKLNGEGVPSPLMYRRASHTDGLRKWRTTGDMSYWTGDIIKRVVTDERYTGCLVAYKKLAAGVSSKEMKPVPREDWIVVEDAHEAIVSKETFDKVQAFIKHPAKKAVRSRICHKFRGILRCACCGKALGRRESQKAFFFCYTARAVEDRPCAEIRLYEDKLEQELQEAVKKRADAAEPEAGADVGRERLEKAVKESRRMAARYKAMQKELFEDYAEERLGREEYLRRRQELSVLLEENGKMFLELSEKLALMGHEETAIPDVGDTGETAASGLTREMIVTHVKEVRVSGKDTLEIVWKDGK